MIAVTPRSSLAEGVGSLAPTPELVAVEPGHGNLRNRYRAQVTDGHAAGEVPHVETRGATFERPDSVPPSLALPVVGHVLVVVLCEPRPTVLRVVVVLEVALVVEVHHCPPQSLRQRTDATRPALRRARKPQGRRS